MFPGVSGPGLGLGLIGGGGSGPETPEFLARLEVVGGNPAIGTGFIGRGAEDDHVADNQGSDVILIALLPLGHFYVPDHVASFCVDGKEMAIDSGPQQGVAGDRHAFVHLVGVVVSLRIQGMRKLPVLTASDGVERYRLEGRAGVHDAIDHQRRILHFGLIVPSLHVDGMVNPFHLQVLARCLC